MKDKFNLTTGSILQKLLLVALPIMGTQLMQMAYNLVDMYFLGKLGASAVAASGTAGMFMWLSMGPMILARTGTEVGVAQSIGHNDIKDAKKYAQNGLLLAIVSGLCFSALYIVFHSQLVGFFNIQETNVVKDTEAYLTIVAIAFPFTFSTSVLDGIFSASGNSKPSFLCHTTGLLLNIVIDPIFIFTFKMGVQGAAYATLLSQMVVFLCLILSFHFNKNKPFKKFKYTLRFAGEKIKSIFRVGIPTGLETMLFCVLTMISNRMLATYGANVLAIFRVTSQIESLSWLISGGFSTALVAFVGQNYGAGNSDRIKNSVKLSITVMVIWETIVTIVLFFFGKYLFYLFLPDDSLLEIADRFMKILAICQISMALEKVYGAAFKGVGKSNPPAISSVVSNIGRVAFAYALSLTSLKVYGIQWGMCIGAVVRGVWIAIWYYKEERKGTLISNFSQLM